MQRFQTSPNSELRYIDLKRTVEEMANFTYATLKEKTDAIRVSSSENETFIRRNITLCYELVHTFRVFLFVTENYAVG